MSAGGVKHVIKKLINIFISEDIDNMPLESRVVYIWVIDQVFGQDTKILSSFFFCVFMDRDRVKVQKLAKKERGLISSHLDRTSLINKGFVKRLSEKYFFRDTAGSPERAW